MRQRSYLQSSFTSPLLQRLFMGFVLTLSFLGLTSGKVSAASLTLKNGAEFIAEQDKRSPRDFVMISFKGGNGLIPKTEQGVGQILSAMLSEGPAGMSSEAYRQELFLLAGEIHYSINSRLASAYLIAPSDKLEKVLALALRTLKKPKLDQETYQLARTKVEAALAQREDDMRSSLRYFALRDAFDYHPDVLDGTPSRLSLKNVKLKTVEKALPILFDPRYLITAAVGPSEPQTLQKLLETSFESQGFLAKSLVKRPFTSPNQDAKPKGPAKIVLLNRPGATDNQVLYLMRRKIPHDNGELIALELANKALGGGMQGSLFKVLREERGLTYGAGSGVNEDLGYWSIASFASTDKLADLMAGIQEVVSSQAKLPIDKNTADLLKGDMLTQWREGRELPSDRMSDALSAKIYGRDLSFQEKMDEWITKATEKEITRAGGAYFDLAGAYIYVMGDKAKLEPVMQKLGYKGPDVRIVEASSIL